MLQSELKKLQDLSDALRPPDGQKGKVQQDKLKARSEIAAECARVKDALTKAIFSQARENLTERYIQFHQAGIIGMADQLQAHLTAGCSPEIQLTTGFFITQLCGLLDYIEQFFTKYFDLDAAVPEPYRLISLKHLEDTVSAVQAHMSERLQAPLLKACLADYLHCFVHPLTVGNPSFRELVYLKTFLLEAQQVFGNNEATDLDEQFRRTLVYLNFNHLGFLVYYQEQIRAELELADTHEQHLSLLSAIHGQIKSWQSKPGFSYAPAWPPIKTMLETWLSDEMALLTMLRERGPVTLANLPETSEKMALNLSVAHLACLTRLLFEENYYGSSSVTDILKFMVRHFRSKKQEHISTGSISKEYYGTTQVTAALVRDLLQRMTTRLNKMYFPVWAVICAAVAGCS